MQNYSIILPFPPSVNTYYRNVRGKTLLSAKGRRYQKLVVEKISNPPNLSCNLHISILLNPPDNKRRDLDNFAFKALWDSLTKAKVWIDDSQVKSCYAEWGEVVENGQVFIEISVSAKA